MIDLQEIEYHEVVQISQPQNQQSQSQPKLQQLGTKDESIIEEISSHSIPMPDVRFFSFSFFLLFFSFED